MSKASRPLRTRLGLLQDRRPLNLCAVSLIKFGRPSDDRTRRGSLKIPRIRSSCWFDKKKVRLFVRNRAVFDSSWHDKKLAWTENDISFPHLNRDLTFQDEKEVVRIIMFVPSERSFYLDHHQIVAIELADSSGLVILGKGGQLRSKINFF